MIPPNFSWELTSTLSSFFKIGTSTFVVETNYTNFLLNTIRFARSFVSNNSLLRNPQQTPVATPNKSRWYTLYVHNIWIVLFTAVLYDESLELLELLLRINFSFVFVEISFLAMVICPCQNGASGARKINRDRFYKSNNPQIWWIWSNLFSRFITNFRNCSFYRLNWRQTLKISPSLWHIHCEKYIVRFYQGVFFLATLVFTLEHYLQCKSWFNWFSWFPDDRCDPKAPRGKGYFCIKNESGTWFQYVRQTWRLTNQENQFNQLLHCQGSSNRLFMLLSAASA